MGQLEDMQVFIRVVEAAGISRAAEQLGVTKSAVSRRLSELEKRLGTRLINRTTRSASLTDAGRSYYQQALKVVDQVAEINGEMRNADMAAVGTVRLSVPLSFGLQHLAPAIDLFMRQHPLLNIQLDLADRKVDLIEEGFDLALRIAEPGDSSMQAHRICPCRHVLAASPDYLQHVGLPQSPDDLPRYRFLKYSGSSNAHWIMVDANGERHVPHLNEAIAANNGDFLLQMAIAGHGIVILPSFICWQALSSGELVQLLPDYSLPVLSAWFLYPQNRFLPRRVRLLIDFVIERFGDKPYWDAAIPT